MTTPDWKIVDDTLRLPVRLCGFINKKRGNVLCGNEAVALAITPGEPMRFACNGHALTSANETNFNIGKKRHWYLTPIAFADNEQIRAAKETEKVLSRHFSRPIVEAAVNDDACEPCDCDGKPRGMDLIARNQLRADIHKIVGEACRTVDLSYAYQDATRIAESATNEIMRLLIARDI